MKYYGLIEGVILKKIEEDKMFLTPGNIKADKKKRFLAEVISVGSQVPSDIKVGAFVQAEDWTAKELEDGFFVCNYHDILSGVEM